MNQYTYDRMTPDEREAMEYETSADERSRVAAEYRGFIAGAYTDTYRLAELLFQYPDINEWCDEY
jgi:hypothetical protein